MSSKIPHPHVGLPVAATVSRAVPKASGAGAATQKRGAKRGEAQDVRGRGGPSTTDDFHEGDTLGGRNKDRSHDERPGGAPRGGSAPRSGPQGALSPPQAQEGARRQSMGPQVTAAALSGQRADRAQWARLLSLASPERLAQGAAVLERHQAALDAFAKIVPGLGKAR